MEETNEDSQIKLLRETIKEFKKAYLSEDAEEDTGDYSIQNVESGITDIRNHLDTLYQILLEVFKNNGNVPNTHDTVKKSIYTVFENKGIFPALRANLATLKEKFIHYLILDLHTYPFTISTAHINNLKKRGIVGSNKIVSNKEFPEDTSGAGVTIS
jgi:hypothetical protein